MSARDPERLVVGVVSVACLAGLVAEVAVDGAAFYAIAGWVVIVSILRRPRAAIPLLLAFLTIQDPIAAHLKELSKPLAGAVKSLDELAILATALRTWCLWRRGELGWVRLKDWAWAAGFVVAGLASTALHGQGLAPSVLGLVLACRFFAYVWLVWSVPWREGDGARLLRVLTWTGPLLLVLGAIGFALPGLTESLLPNEVSDEYARNGLNAFRAPFVNPGVYGWACAVAALAGIASWLAERKGARLGAAGAAVMGAVASLRKKPLLGIPIALAVCLSHLTRRQKAYVLAAAVALAAGAVYWGGTYVQAITDEVVANYMDPESREDTARGAMTVVSFVVANQYAPLGAGFGRFGSYPSVAWYSSVYEDLGISNIYGFSEEQPHYLMDLYWPHLLGEVGYLGTLCMAVWFWTLWRRLKGAATRLEAVPALRPVAVFATMILAESLVESAGFILYEMPLSALAVALPIGIALRLADDRPSGAAHEDPVPHLEDQQRVELPPAVAPPGEVLP